MSAFSNLLRYMFQFAYHFNTCEQNQQRSL